MNFQIDAFSQFDKKWALLCAGDKDGFNAMTVSWGGLGTLWFKPVATVYVRPTRYTCEFMEKSLFFTLSFFPESQKPKLSVMGSRSGRDCDKIALAGLTPKYLDKAVTFEEAETTLVCEKIYSADMKPENMLPELYADMYKAGEPLHRIYIGEVMEIL